MHQIQLSDRLYKQAQKRAEELGFATVDEYVANLVAHDVEPDTDNYDHLFTPEVLADLDSISARIKAGEKTYSVEEVREHFKNKRVEWERNNPK